MAALEPGQRLGSYIVEAQLGRGSTGEVYRAVHKTLDRNVAIKVLNPGLNADPSFPLRFLREAKAVAKLKHPNIVTVYDFDEERGLAYLVMELAEGGTLRDRAKDFATLSDAVEALQPICEALEYAHGRGIVHRDIKPMNVLIDGQHRPLLADFGLARIMAESLGAAGTDTGGGTPYYMAPEQALGESVDRRADVYALGIMTYELLSGRVPYTGPTAYAIMQHHLSSPPPSIRSVLPDAPAELDATIRRATQKRPEERFESAAAFAAALRHAVEAAPTLALGSRASGAVEEEQATRMSAGNARTNGAAASEPLVAGLTSMRIDAVGADTLGPASAARTAPAADDLEQTLVPRQLPASASPDELDQTMLVSNSATPTPATGEMLVPPSDSGPGAPVPPAAPFTGAALDEAPLPPLPRRRRTTALNLLQIVAAGVLLMVLAYICGVGIWLAAAGRAAAVGSPLSGLSLRIFDHLTAVRIALAGLAVALGVLNISLMRVAVLSDQQIPTTTYLRLRQYHRFVGYSTALIAIAVYIVTWTAVLGLGVASGPGAITLAIGTLVLVAAVAKVAIVRYVYAQRRHLPAFGVALFVLLLGLFVSSIFARQQTARAQPAAKSAVPAAAAPQPTAVAPIAAPAAATAPVPAPAPAATAAAQPTAAPTLPRFAPFVGQWSTGPFVLTAAADGTATVAFPVGRSCATNPAPCDDPTAGGQVGGHGIVIFDQAGDPTAMGRVTATNDPGALALGPIELTLTHFDSYDTATLTQGGALAVKLCSPAARQAAPRDCGP